MRTQAEQVFYKLFRARRRLAQQLNLPFPSWREAKARLAAAKQFARERGEVPDIRDFYDVVFKA